MIEIHGGSNVKKSSWITTCQSGATVNSPLAPRPTGWQHTNVFKPITTTGETVANCNTLNVFNLKQASAQHVLSRVLSTREKECDCFTCEKNDRIQFSPIKIIMIL